MIPVAERIRLLRAAGLAPELADGELRALATAVDFCEIAAGEVLIPEEGPSRQSFLVVEGIADIHSSGATVATVGPGSFFNALVADRRPIGATAQTPMRVFVIAPSVAQRFGLAPKPPPRSPQAPPIVAIGITAATTTAPEEPQQGPFG